MADWVVRAGIATPAQLITGYTEHLGLRGTYGFSVQYEPGINATIDYLCRIGQVNLGIPK